MKAVFATLCTVAAASTCSLYQIADGSCGQSDLNCDYIKYAKAAEKGLADGTCADQGYTVKTGTQTRSYPIIGDITITTYSKDSLEASKLPNIVELAESLPTLSTLVSAVVAADLADTLSSPGPFTVFAPTNQAFGHLPSGTLDNLMKPENKDQLVDILTYHVLPSQVLSKDIKHGVQEVATVEGKNLVVHKQLNTISVGPSSQDLKHVLQADNLASNGVAHVVDGVLLPPTLPNLVQLAESVKDLSTLVAAVVAGDLADTLSAPGPFTLFAPTNKAFTALPAGTLDNLMKPENKAQLVDILTYHVLPVKAAVKDLDLFQPVKTVEGKPLHITKWGDVVKVGPSLKSEDLKTVTGADNMANNGVAHIIDGVLIPPAEAKPAKVEGCLPNLVELAESVTDLSTLVAAVVGADLADTLSSPGAFTLFAPTNEAFGALPAGTLDNLMKPENKAQLVDILTYHVLPVKAAVKDLNLFQPVKTVEGKPLHITKWGNVVKVGPSLKSEDLKTVTGADNMANNGVAHIIDGVLIPPAGAVVV